MHISNITSLRTPSAFPRSEHTNAPRYTINSIPSDCGFSCAPVLRLEQIATEMKTQNRISICPYYGGEPRRSLFSRDAFVYPGSIPFIRLFIYLAWRKRPYSESIRLMENSRGCKTSLLCKCINSVWWVMHNAHASRARKFRTALNFRTTPLDAHLNFI